MTRLDQLLVERGEFGSREKAKRTIMAGLVAVDGLIVDKPGTAVGGDANVEVRASAQPYVSRGGLKLEHALDSFAIDVTGAICLDIGASTGGFTDCLLQRRAARVYAVDVGHGQLDYGLRQDPRVSVMERTNARYLTGADIPERVDLATFDVSFISLTKVVPAIIPFVRSRGRLVTLVKPQFEAGRGKVGKGGVVRDEAFRAEVIARCCSDLERLGLESGGVVDSPITGARGNLEALAMFTKP